MTSYTSIKLIMELEGGYVNDPNDPGGETKYGISKRSYPDLDIKAPTEAQAESIYQEDYWDACHCDDLPSSIALLVFDAAVNQGMTAAIKMLQHLLHVEEDGKFGPITLAAIDNAALAVNPIDYAAERMVRYGKNANFDIYGRGWARRLMRVFEESINV